MSDNEIKVGVEIEAQASPETANSIQRVLNQAKQLEASIKTTAAQIGMAYSKIDEQLSNAVRRQKELGALTSAYARGDLATQLANANSARILAEKRADPFSQIARTQSAQRQIDREILRVFESYVSPQSRPRTQLRQFERGMVREAGLDPKDPNLRQQAQEYLARARVLQAERLERQKSEAEASEARKRERDERRLAAQQKREQLRESRRLEREAELERLNAERRVEAAKRENHQRELARIKEAEREYKRLHDRIIRAERNPERRASTLLNARARVEAANGLTAGSLGTFAGVLDDRQSRMDEFAPRNTASTRLGRLAGRAQLFGDYATIGAAVGAVAYTGYQTVELEKSLATLQAITRATDQEMSKLTDTVFELGQSTRFSTTELAAAATVLGQAGYSANQVRQVLPDIANLALAAGTTIEESTQLVSSIMTVFDMSISRSAYVADVLTQALNGSKLSLEQLSLGLQYAGNIAADSGVSFEELSAALGAMSNAGIRSGSTLGTGFRAFLQELQSPSEAFLTFLKDADLTLQDVDVRTKDVADVLELLRSRGLDSAKALQMFDIRAASAYSALSSNTEVMRDLIESYQLSGVAAGAAERQMGTFSAQFSRLGNAAVEVTTKVGAPFIAVLTAVTGALASLLSGLADMAPILGPLIAGTAAYFAAVTVLIPGLALLKTSLAGVSVSALLANVSITTLTAGLRTMLVALGPWGLAIGAATAVVAFFVGNMSMANRKFQEAKTALDEATGKVTEYKDRLEELDTFLSQLTSTQSDVNSLVDQARTKFGSWGDTLRDNISTVDELRGALERLRGELASEQELALNAAARQADTTVAAARTRVTRELTSLALAGRSDLELRQLIAAAHRNVGDDEKFKTALINIQDYLDSDRGRQRYEREGARLATPVADYVSALSTRRGIARDQDQFDVRESQSFRVFGQQMASMVRNNSGPFSSDQIRTQFQPQIAQLRSFYATAIANETGIDRATIEGLMDQDPNYMEALRKFSIDTTQENRRRNQSELRAAQAAYRNAPASQLPAAEQRLRQARIADLTSKNPSGVTYSLGELEELMAQDREARRQALVGRGPSPSLVQAEQNARTRLDEFRQRGSTVTPYNSFVGARVSGVLGEARASGRHNGVDYAHAVGTPLHAPLDGEVIETGYDDRNGNFVRIRMADGRTIGMAHLSQAGVATGDRVTRGQQIGLSGNTGRSTGPHTHVTLRDAQGQLQNAEQFFASSVEAQVQENRAAAEQAWSDYYSAALALQNSKTEFMEPDERSRSDAEFQVQMAQMRAEFLRESSREALEVIAQRYERLRSNQELALRLEVETTGQLSDQALQSYRQASDLALQTAIAAVENPGSNAAIEEIARITEDSKVKFTETLISLIEAQANFLNQEIEEAAATRALGFAAQEAEVSRLSNFYGSRNLSDAQRILGERRQREIAQARAMDDLGVAHQKLSVGQNELSRLQAALAAGENPAKLGPKINEAQQQVAELTRRVQELEIEISATFGQTAPIDSFRGAVSTAFAAFMEQANLSQPIFTTITDGLLGAFEKAQAGFKGLLRDVLTGTKTMGDAFRDFALSVLESLMDLAAEIAAREILKWLINMFAPNFGSVGGMTTVGGGGSITGHKIPGLYQGGLVRAYQGSAAPFRDSVPHLLQPGEFVMSKTATDFIGVDTLRQMNASGNRRMTSMPTVQQAIRREPDEVNVWVVAPNQKPPMGKKDIVATISEDIMLNGEVKRLIKAVQVGAA